MAAWRSSFLILLLAGWSACAWAHPVDESKLVRVKAAYLYHMLHLTYWPDAPGETSGPLKVVCIGHDAAAVGDLLASRTGRAGHDFKVDVRTMESLADRDPDAPTITELLADARIVYFSSDIPADKVLRLLGPGRLDVLVAGDGPDFARVDGMVGFFILDQRVRIAVNLSRVEAAGIRMSAEFLQHAEIVGNGKGG